MNLSFRKTGDAAADGGRRAILFGATGYTGVSPQGANFRARYGSMHIGKFDTALQAAVAYARWVLDAAKMRAEVVKVRYGNEPSMVELMKAVKTFRRKQIV